MDDDISDIQEFYNGQVEHEDERLQRHQLERDLTWRYFKDYLPPSGSILEIGAATGGHTEWLGYLVTAVDLSGASLVNNRRRLESVGLIGQVEYHIADARTLENVPGHEFDAVLLMGPLYHLVALSGRQQAVRQSTSRLKDGGIFMSAWISRLGILGDLISKVPDWVREKEEVKSILEIGYNPENPRQGGFRGYFALPEEVVPLQEWAGLETILLAATEPVISADDESYNRLGDELRSLWLDLLYGISQRRELLASSRHWLYIGKK